MPRSDSYLGRYMAALAIPALYEQVREDYAETERQREVLDALIQQQRQDIANLEEIFRQGVADSTELTRLLAQSGALDRRALAEARQTFTASEIERLGDLVTSNQAAAYQAAQQLSAEKSLTSAQRDQVADLFVRAGAEDIAADVRRLATTERGVTEETRRAMTATERALEDLRAERTAASSRLEESLSAARARLAELEERAEAIEAPAGMTREQEIARRQLEARGYDFSKPYIRLQRSPYYGAILKADELVDAALAGAATADPAKFSERGVDSILVPSTKAQRLARELVVQTDQAGRPFRLKQAERQLRKTLDGEELQDALAFALAFRRTLDEGLNSAEAAEAKIAATTSDKAVEEAKKVAATAEKAAVKSARDAFLRDVEELEIKTRPEEVRVEEVAPPRRAERAPEPPAAPTPAEPPRPPAATAERLQAAYQDPTRTEEQRRRIAAELERRGLDVPTPPAQESEEELFKRYGIGIE